MKTFLFTALIFVLSSAQAGSKGAMELRAFVPLTVKTSVSQFNVNGQQALLILSNQVNSDDLLQESQKIEVEGVSQAGLQAYLQKVVTSNRTIQYHLLISRLKSTAANDRPIFIKITAN